MPSNAERIALAEQAHALANSDLYRQVRASAEARVVEAWKLARTMEDRERTHATLQGLYALDGELLTLINDGEMALRDERRA